MEIDLDTFLTTVYCHIDDVYQMQFAAQKPCRCGHQPEMSDSEVLTIAVLSHWQERSSERGFVRYVRAHWQAYFPRMLSQSAFNRRVRDLTHVLETLGPTLASQITSSLVPGAVYEVLDGVPVPVMRRCRGERHRLFGDEAGVGRGGTDREWYYGMRLLTVVNSQGLITGFVLGPASTDERWLADAVLRWRVNPTAPPPSLEDLNPILGAWKRRDQRRGPTGPLSSQWSAGLPPRLPVLADLGFRGEAWQAHWRDHYGVLVVTERVYEAVTDEQQRQQWSDWLHAHRQLSETVNDLLDRVLHLKAHRARTFAGLRARIGAKVAACNLLIACNAQADRPLFAHFSPLA